MQLLVKIYFMLTIFYMNISLLKGISEDSIR